MSDDISPNLVPPSCHCPNFRYAHAVSYCVFLAFEAVFIFFVFPETHGKSLEELAFLYEDDKQAEQNRRVIEHADDGPQIAVTPDREDSEKGVIERVDTSKQ